MPLTDIHLYSHLTDELEINGSTFSMYIFFSNRHFYFIDCMHQLYESFNCVFRQPCKRSRRKKAVGELKNNLIVQFLTESLVTCFLSFQIATAIRRLTLTACATS